MRRHRTEIGRLRGLSRPVGMWRAGVIAGMVAVGLTLTAAPAYASHFAISSESYLVPTPPDPGGLDATIEVYRVGGRVTDRVHGTFDASGERVTVSNGTAGWGRWRLSVPGMADPYGFVAPGQCVMWGASRTRAALAGCTYWGDRNIPEGTPVRLSVCVRTWHGWVCPSYDQQARGRG